MIEWSRLIPGENFFDARVAEATPEVLTEFWAKVLDEIAPAPFGGGWEILVAYVTVEMGSVLVYPTRLDDPMDETLKRRVRLTIRAWAAEYNAISRRSRGRDVEGVFDAAYRSLFESQASALRTAIGHPSVLPRFEALAARPNFAVYYVDGIEEVYKANLKLLWGERPEPWIVAGSAKELFEWIMHIGNTHPPSCMEFEGEILRSATFFGGAATDEYIETLEAVPNVAELCRDLREITLDHARITPDAVDRLRRLLPHVKLREKKPRTRKKPGSI